MRVDNVAILTTPGFDPNLDLWCDVKGPTVVVDVMMTKEHSIRNSIKYS